MRRTLFTLLLTLLLLPAYGQKGKGWSKYGYAGKTTVTEQEEVPASTQKKKKAPTPKRKAVRVAPERFERPIAGTKTWFVGGHLAANFAVADNITDHPFFHSFGDALGLGFGVYGGKFFTPNVGVRVELGYSKVKNRGDHGYVDVTRKEAPNGLDPVAKDGRIIFDPQGHVFQELFDGNGYYHFGVFDTFVDAVFDFAGPRSRALNRPVHLLGIVGIGAFTTTERKLDLMPGTTAEQADGALIIIAKDKSPVTTLAARLGFIFGYFINPNLSVNLEGNLSVTGDKFDGIEYGTAADFLLKASLGVTYHF